MEYRLRFTEITTLRPYMFIVIGFLVGCVMAWLIINYVSDNLLYLVRIFLYLGTIYVLITSIKMFFNKTLTIEYTDNEEKRNGTERQTYWGFIALII